MCANLSLNEPKKAPLAESVGRKLGSGNCLVGKVIAPKGRFLSHNEIANHFWKYWNVQHSFHHMDAGRNTVFFKFNSPVDLRRVQQGSPWTIDTGFALWLMNKDAAESIGNVIGQFVESDCDQDGLAIGVCLRTRVSIDITKSLCQSVEVNFKDMIYACEISYERLPDFCYFCEIIGHTNQDCEAKILSNTTHETIINFKKTLRAASVTGCSSSSSGSSSGNWRRSCSDSQDNSGNKTLYRPPKQRDNFESRKSTHPKPMIVSEPFDSTKNIAVSSLPTPLPSKPPPSPSDELVHEVASQSPPHSPTETHPVPLITYPSSPPQQQSSSSEVNLIPDQPSSPFLHAVPVAFDSPSRRVAKTLTKYNTRKSLSVVSNGRGRGRGRGTRRKLQVTEKVELVGIEVASKRKLDSDLTSEGGKRRRASVETWIKEEGNKWTQYPDWKDKWLPEAPLWVPTPPVGLPEDSVISLLIDEETGWWNHTLIRQLFPQDVCIQVFSIQLGDLQASDSYIWSPNRSGRHTVKSAYHLALNLHNPTAKSSASQAQN
ncbi:OLC1v1016858C1 [Oldenlandia corymbosa var. corymbosa]|uniref:OLC1v1016858C1 n=1 Tax=Oldenlandia corymbosa var. corymbosa TaxID=529605 RepID=A0AAV1E856_OLDCO|nr:OLC1v1016858C1 [Oldenlandia corymbosa var. corymbosa]